MPRFWALPAECATRGEIRRGNPPEGESRCRKPGSASRAERQSHIRRVKTHPESRSGRSKSHPEAQNRAREGPSEGQNGIREGRRRTREGPNRIRRAKITSGLQTAKSLVFPWFFHGFSRFWPFSEGRGRRQRVKVVSSRGRSRFVEGPSRFVEARSRFVEGPSRFVECSGLR